MGTVLLQHGQLTQALACFEQWLQIGNAMGDRRAVSRAMGRMGIAYIHLADNPRALSCFEQQLQIAIELAIGSAWAMHLEIWPTSIKSSCSTMRAPGTTVSKRSSSGARSATHAV